MKKSLFLILSFVLLLSLLLVACGEKTPATSTTPTTSAPTTTTAKPTTTTVKPTTTAPAEDKYGGIWKEAIELGPSKPIGYPAEGDNTSYIDSNPALETLVVTQLDGTVSPMLATSWTVADDGLSVTFNLRKGVKFHDGSDFNADVCKWNLDLQIAAKAANAASWKSIDKVDDYTIRINLTKYQNITLSSLMGLVSQQISKEYVEKNGIEAARWNPVGTGPFILESYERDVKLAYKKNPNYWDKGRPYLDGITMTVIKDSTVRKLAFQKGDINRINVAGGVDATELQKAGFTIRTAPGGTFFLVPDSTNAQSPWANIQVRQAASYAIDRENLAKGLGLGFLNTAYQLYPGYADSKIPDLVLTEYNMTKAKDLLTQAGYPSGFKTTIHNSPRGTPSNYLEAVAEMLRGVGINVNSDFPEAGKYTELRYKGWDGALNHGTTSYVNKNQLFQTSFMGTGADFFSLKIPAAFKDAATASISSKVYDPKLVQAAFKILSDDVTVVPYAEQVQCCFYRNDVHDDEVSIYGFLHFRFRSAWMEKSAR